MAIDFSYGVDSEEKRFLAGILIVHLAEMMKRLKTDKIAHELKKPNGYFSESEFHSRRNDILRYEELRRRGMKMIGADEFDEKLDLNEYETICNLLTRFDIVRDIMGS